MNREIAIFGRHLSASIRTFARANQAELTFPALLSDNELGLLEYHSTAELAVVKVAFDHVDRPFLGELIDQHGMAWLEVFDIEAIPFAALVCGPGQSVYLGQPLPAREPAAMVAASRNGRPYESRYTTEEGWAEFDAEVKTWLAHTPHVTEGSDIGGVRIEINRAPASDIELALRADARAAFQRIKEANSGR